MIRLLRYTEHVGRDGYNEPNNPLVLVKRPEEEPPDPMALLAGFIRPSIPQGVSEVQKTFTIISNTVLPPVVYMLTTSTSYGGGDDTWTDWQGPFNTEEEATQCLDEQQSVCQSAYSYSAIHRFEVEDHKTADIDIETTSKRSIEEHKKHINELNSGDFAQRDHNMLSLTQQVWWIHSPLKTRRDYCIRKCEKHLNGCKGLPHKIEQGFTEDEMGIIDMLAGQKITAELIDEVRSKYPEKTFNVYQLPHSSDLVSRYNHVDVISYERYVYDITFHW